MALFEKSYDELREAFVRSRFAETPMFGQHDIVEWIERERQAKRPHIPEEPTVPLVSQWQRLTGSDLLRVTDPQAAVVLLSNGATPVGNFGIEQTAPRIGNWGPFSQMLGTHVDGARVYVGYHAFVILELGKLLYIQRIMCGIERGVEEEGLISRPFELNMEYTSRAVADVLLGEWARGRPRMQRAREALCDSIEHRVRKERMKAEHDFDTAVAVSADGTKIVNADWVVVRDEDTNQHVRVFRSEQFRTKALRLDRRSAFARRNSNVYGLLEESVTPETITPQVIGEITRRAMWTPHTFGPWPMGFIDCDVNGRNVRIYYSITDLCPSPLPEGGVEVKVY